MISRCHLKIATCMPGSPAYSKPSKDSVHREAAVTRRSAFHRQSCTRPISREVLSTAATRSCISRRHQSSSYNCSCPDAAFREGNAESYSCTGCGACSTSGCGPSLYRVHLFRQACMYMYMHTPASREAHADRGVRNSALLVAPAPLFRPQLTLNSSGSDTPVLRMSLANINSPAEMSHKAMLPPAPSTPLP